MPRWFRQLVGWAKGRLNSKPEEKTRPAPRDWAQNTPAPIQASPRTRQLFESEFAVLYDGVVDPIFLLTIEDGFRFVSINRAFLLATGLQPTQVLGKRVEEVLPASSQAIVLP